MYAGKIFLPKMPLKIVKWKEKPLRENAIS